VLAVVLPVAAAAPGDRGRDPEVERLAAALRGLYAHDAAGARRRDSVTLDGREVPRQEAHRDHPRFVEAAAALLASRDADDAPLGAWLLAALPPGRAREAEPALIAAALGSDPRAAFEAARGLARLGSPAAFPALDRAAVESPSAEVRAAAAWARGRIAERLGAPAPAAPGRPRLPAGFRRGVCWWMSERRDDDGAGSFRELASLGVDWVSIHSWDPLQRGIADPELAPRHERFALRGLPELVRSAHAAGLQVMVKPHLEMRGPELSPEQRRVLRGPDGAARRALVSRLEAWHEERRSQWHGLIEMRSEEDWRRWFEQYVAYILDYARQAAGAGADAFCVGRELDRTAIRRPGEWRHLIARVRGVFRGPLVYSANFDTYDQVGFWDALDFIGISAYFPLSDRDAPQHADLQAGWERALAGVEALSRRFGRPVLLTEVGYPAVADAARVPSRESAGPADIWLQARCYEAALRAVAARPFVHGTFFWLWERTVQPPFRDASYAIAGKPAAYTLASWYRGP